MQEELEFIYIGWCNEGTSDKVWTAFKAGGAYYAGWGARGKSIRFKKHVGRYELLEVKAKKTKKYKECNEFELFAILPEFKEQVASKLTFDILLNKVMPE